MSAWVGWVSGIALIILIAVAVYVSNQQAKLTEEERAADALLQEQKRLAAIFEHKDTWGEEMCNWLFDRKYNVADVRTMAVMNNFQTWGRMTSQNILEKKIAINYTVDMVRLALGEPSRIDEKTITATDNKFRWVYGKPRQGAMYIWFRNGKVTKIKQ